MRLPLPALLLIPPSATPLRRFSRVAMSSASPLPSGSAPEPNFFRDNVYRDALAAGKSVPWDTKKHQPALEAAVGCFAGKVLDVGCGLGDNSRWIGSLQAVEKVTAVDFAPLCIKQAIERGDEGGKVSFVVADVFELKNSLDCTYDTLLDSAVFHCIGDDDTQRRYLAAVTPYVKPGGKLVMLVFSDRNPDPWMGPRRISPAHAAALCGEAGWTVDSLDNNVYYEDTMGRNGGKGGHALILTATKPL